MTKMQIEKVELNNFIGFLLGSPKRIQAATGMVLNDIAFGSRKEVQKTINSEMTVRSKFADRQVRVTKSKFKGNINHLYSIVGSVQTSRFTGWTEQEHGTHTDRHVATTAARGNKSKPIRPSARLAKPYFHPKRFPKSGSVFKRASRSKRGGLAAGNTSVAAMLNILRHMKYRLPFIITRHSQIPPGLYRLRGKDRLKMLQGFDPPKQQPKRLPWMAKSVKKYFRSGKLNRAWFKAAKRVLAPRKRR